MFVSSFRKSKLGLEVRACLLLSVPLAAAQLAQQMTSFADTVMMGLLGSQAIAAGGLGAIFFGTLLLICTGVISAVSPLVAEAYGSGKSDRIGPVVRMGLWLSLLIALPGMLLLWNTGGFLRHLGQPETNVVMTLSFLRAIVWGFFPALAFAALRSFVAALSRPQIVMVITLCSVSFNIVANYVLALGKFGFPALGLAGIGLASTLSFWGGLIAIVCYLLSQPTFSKYEIFSRLFCFDGRVFRELVQMGWAIGVLYGVETGLFAVTAVLMGYLGTTILAAHQIALQTIALAFMIPAGISYATTVRVGQLVGQGDPRGARLSAYVSLGLCTAFMGTVAIVFWLVPEAIVSIYLDIHNPANFEVVAIATTLLRVAAVFQLMDGTQVVAAGALRGLKDTRAPMLIGFCAYWGVGLSSGYWLGLRLGWGGVGLWLGLALGLTVASIIFTWRFNMLIASLIKKPILDPQSL
jgi:multidrug resistance protein, MATE family